MRRLLITVSVTLGALLIAYLGLRLLWHNQERRVLNVYILNKSVGDFREAQHKSFVWLLHQNRYHLPNYSPYSYTLDFYGFIPQDEAPKAFEFRSIRINEVEASAAVFDLAYFVDCYGVTPSEWYRHAPGAEPNQQLYGGLNQNDFLLMRRMLEKGKLVIAERHLLGSPTNALIRQKTETLLGIGWSGWSGKYFETLNPDAPGGPPTWMENLYESQHIGAWPSNHAGLVLIHNDGLIQVLTVPYHLESGPPTLTATQGAAKRFGITRAVPFDDWLEFIDPKANHVLAHYTLHTTPQGEQALAKLNLTPILPAVIEGSGDLHFIYLCGEFASNPVRMWTSNLTLGREINSLLHRRSQANRSTFFNHFYTPLMEGILQEYHTSIQADR